MARILASIFPMALIAAAPQGSPPIPRLGETIEVSIVNLDVFVTDRHGNRVHGLARDDFEVLEDGKLQQISNFSEYGSDSPASVASSSVRAESQAAAVTPAPAPPVRQPRTVVLFVDDMKMANFKVAPVFGGIKKLLHEVVAPGDSVMIVRWQLRPVVRQAPTFDLARVDATLDDIAASSIGAQRDLATEMRDRQADVQEFFAAAGVTVADDDPFVLFDARSAAQIALYEMKEKVKALNAIVTSMANSNGKKVLLVVSHRLGAYAGGEFFYANTNRLTPEDQVRFDTTGMMQTLIDNANAHAVTIYTVFPEGLDTSFGGAAQVRGNRGMAFAQAGRMSNNLVLMNETSSLQRIAEQTGGTMAWSAVDIVKMLPRVRDDFESYYSLAYRVGSRHENTAHKVVVRVKEREYTVRSRKQYVERSEASEMHDSVLANLLRPPTEQAAIPVHMSIGTAVVRKKGVWSLPIRVEFPLSSLTTVTDGDKQRGSFSVYIASARLIGSSAEVTRQTVPFTANAEQKAATFSYDFELLTDLLADKVSVGVYDEVSHEKGFTTGELPLRPAAR